MNLRLFLLLFCGFILAGCQPESPNPDVPAGAAETDNDFVGLSLSDAEKVAVKRDLKYRVTMLDGKPQPATRDYRLDRVNFAVEKGKVVGVSRG